MPLGFNNKTLIHKSCCSIGDVLWNYSHAVIFASHLHVLLLYKHTGTGMYAALCPTTMQNHLIFSSTFWCHTVCACDKSGPCCGTPVTKPTLTKPPKTRFFNLLSPKTKANRGLHFLLANDALIVQVNKLALLFPWITKSMVQFGFSLLVFFVSLTWSRRLLSHARRAFPMRCSVLDLLLIFVFQRRVTYGTRENNRNNNNNKKWNTIEGLTEMLIHSGIFCTVFITFSFIAEMYLTHPCSPSFKTLPLLSLFLYGSNIFVLNRSSVE